MTAEPFTDPVAAFLQGLTDEEVAALSDASRERLIALARHSLATGSEELADTRALLLERGWLEPED